MRAYILLANPLVQERPGLTTAIATGDEAALDAIERLVRIHCIARELAPGDATVQAREKFAAMWPGWR